MRFCNIVNIKIMRSQTVLRELFDGKPECKATLIPRMTDTARVSVLKYPN